MMLLIAILFAAFLIIGIPVAFALALAAFPVFVLSGTMPPSVAIQKMVTATQSFPLLAVPLFIFAGNLMNATGITERLIRFSRLATGWIAGGLGQVSILLSLLMGGISGSAVADASMEARVLGPSMIDKGGYSRADTAAVIAFGSIITATIPPSIGLILFGFINEVSIGRLFVAGLVPGLVLTVILMITAWLIAKRNGYTADLAEPPTFRAVWASFLDCIWAIAFPFILIAGFRSGLFTATESGAFLVAYALFIGVFVYRELNLTKLYDAAKHSVSDLGMVMLLIMMAAVLGYALTIERGPQQLTELMMSLTDSSGFILLSVMVLLVFSGMFLEGAANILLITPIVLPVLTQAGFDPVHMGILIVSLINFGGITPPVGVIMFTVCGILKVKSGEFTRAALPYFVALFVFLAALALFPALSLFLPGKLM